MQVKALTEVKDMNQTATPDGSGGFKIAHHLTHLLPGEVYDLPEEQAKRLVALGHASADLKAPTHAERARAAAADTAPAKG